MNEYLAIDIDGYLYKRPSHLMSLLTQSSHVSPHPIVSCLSTPNRLIYLYTLSSHVSPQPII